MAVILRFFAEFGSFGANHVKVVEVTAILSAAKTRCSAIAERPRCRVCYSFRQK